MYDLVFAFYFNRTKSADISGYLVPNLVTNMEQEDLIERDLTLTVLLPEGHERTVTVHGR